MKKKLLVCVLITVSVMVYALVGLLFYLNQRNHVSADSDKNNSEITFYTVNFNSLGGSPVDAQHVTAGSYAMAPEVTKSGCEFLGWYLSLDDAEPFDFNKPIASDLTLYANWRVIYYTVTFDTCGGENLSAQSIISGNKIEAPIPVWNDLEFGGWYLDENYQQPFNQSSPITHDITLYAKWPLTLALSEYDQSYVVKKYTGTKSTVTLPATYRGLPITAIDDFAFENCTGLETVIIPEGYTSIGMCAFYGCCNLTSVTLPDSMTLIGAYAFRWCPFQI